ncbi:MAG TPA: fibronectin type III domain-containing protein [Lachnospiraceae bacterium]|nr:fibronectin type III domain-containing protein [Lachnospiraceae bacterium]HEX3076181.1 fibronectin type III domain-containing protein [Lachnospiraceae bacterium]
MMKSKRTIVRLFVMVLLIVAGLSPVSNVQAGEKVEKTTAKVENTPVGADLKVTWSEVNGANGYDVYMSTTKATGYEKVKTTDGTSYTTSGIKKDKTYYFKIKAYKIVETTEPAEALDPAATTDPIVITTDDPVVKQTKIYGGYSKVVSGKTCKYLLNTPIDEGGQEVYFYWLWDGKSIDDYYWDAYHKCEDILYERYSGKAKKTVGSSKKACETDYSINGKIVCLATPHVDFEE